MVEIMGERLSETMMSIRKLLVEVRGDKACKFSFKNISGAYIGNISRFIRHECEERANLNLVIKKNEAKQDSLLLFAQRDIKRKEEVTMPCSCAAS